MTPPVEPEFDLAHHAGLGVIVGYPHRAQPTQHQVVMAINTFGVAHGFGLVSPRGNTKLLSGLFGHFNCNGLML